MSTSRLIGAWLQLAVALALGIGAVWLSGWIAATAPGWLQMIAMAVTIAAIPFLYRYVNKTSDPATTARQNGDIK